MLGIEVEFLCELEAHVMPLPVGATPLGYRLIGNVTGGHFEGPRLSGKLLASGADWTLARADGTTSIDARVILETDDGVCVYMTYGGRIDVPKDVAAKFSEAGGPEAVDPATYYLRTNPLFEAPVSSAYNWLNNIVCIGNGRITPRGVTYRIFEVK